MNNITFLILIYIFNFLLVINIIFKKNTNPYNTLAWLIFLCLLPIIGLFLFLIFGRSTNFDTQILRKRDEDEKINDLFKSKFKFNNCNNFNTTSTCCEQKNKIKVFFNGQKKFQSLFEDIQNSTEFIHIQYYIVKNHRISHELIYLLNEKAKEGVKIKFLMDYMGTLKTNKKMFYGLHENFCISYFKLNILSRFNFHNHRKTCVIDGKIGYLGGFNVAKEYLGKSDKFNFWRDIHIRVEGDSVYDIHKNFIMDWNFSNKYLENQLTINPYYFPQHNINTTCNVLTFTSGIDTDSYIYLFFNYLISSAKKSICIQTPYFIPNETILDNLKIASLRGVDIKIIVPKEKDHPFVKYANTAYFNQLINTSIKFYHYEYGFLHSKLIIIDNEICSIGSANMDYRSFKINFEICSIIFDDLVVKKVYKQFLDDLQNSTPYELKDYNNRSKITIIKENISKLLSPLL